MTQFTGTNSAEILPSLVLGTLQALGDDQINALGGDDLVAGWSGNDVLNGGQGADILIGGILDVVLNVGTISLSGIDTASYVGSSSGVTVDLSTVSSLNVMALGIQLALTNASAGHGGDAEGDILVGITNLTGSSNEDVLTGNADSNILNGGDGNDTLDGRGGADTMAGGDGNDTYYADASDTIIELANGGTDSVLVSTNYVLADSAGEMEILATTNDAGLGAINLTGNSFGQTIRGNAGNNVIDGGGGNDVMIGLSGNDTYYVDKGGDSVQEDGGGGTDTVLTAVNYTLEAGSEIEFFSTTNDASTKAIRLTGNEFGQTLTGNAGDNMIHGGGGTDIMGGLGGGDIYYVDSSDDQVLESVGGGTDGVVSTVSYTLAAGQEIENLSGVRSLLSPLTLTGNEFDNTITSGGGVDTLIGLGGNDRYFVNFALDHVVEAAGGGADTVYSSVSYALAVVQDVEVLVGNGGTKALTLTGNELGNAIQSGAGNDTLVGLAGNDSYYVNNAADRVIEAVGGGIDTVRASVDYMLEDNQQIEILMANAGSGGLTLTGNNLNNYLQGGSGADTLTGGLGMDSFTGGGGSDTFVFNSLADSGVTNADRIYDFTDGIDKLDVHLIDADGDAGNGDTAFVLDAYGDNSFATGHIMQTIIGSTLYLSFNADGDAANEMTIALLNHPGTIGTGDLIA